MSRILVDTTIWINHFQKKESLLNKVLLNDEVVMHPLVFGELHLGKFNSEHDRIKILELLHLLEKVPMDPIEDVLLFINKNQIYGLKIGLIDSFLLYSCIKHKLLLWTLDKNLRQLAQLYHIDP